jgi:Amino acid transporters
MGANPQAQRNQLKPNAIGLVGVVFMVVAFSAPITAMTGNLPVAVGFGNGSGAPAGFIIATIVLAIFSVGFVALAKHITAAGAFYTFVSRGLARPFGLAAGVMSMITYMTMEAGLVGIFAAFCQSTFEAQLGVDIHWMYFAVLALVVIGLLAYKDISLAAKVLGLVLICEIALLSIMAFGVLFQGGGPDGLMLNSINPLSAFDTNGVDGGVIGLGLLFAFWSWVGYESTAIYGEESKDPKRIVPRATMIAVIGIGVFYTFISWMAVAGSGARHAIELASGSDPFELLYSPMREFVGGWGVIGFQWFVLGGSFACALAIHNSATRYLYAFGRDGLLPRKLGAAHHRHQSPHIASVTQSVFAAVLIVVCWITNVDPYATLFVLVAIMATVSLLLVQTMCSVAAISYFHIRKQHPETAHWWRTMVAPIIGGAGMLYVCYLLLTNMESAAGAASETLFFKLIPWLVLLMLVGSVAVALYLRRARPEIYGRIGSTVFAEPGTAPKAEELTSR